ncbi:vacuolar membrane-associated protein iml1, partial [Quaeritorhiza haematococci]
ISIAQHIAASFELQSRTDVIVRKIDPTTVFADYIELTFRDQYIGRSDMWRLKMSITGTCVHQGKKVVTLGIRAVVKDIIIGKRSCRCGYVTPNTKTIFRSESAKYFIFIQMSREMWEFDEDGEMFFEKCVYGFLPELFDRWKQLGTNHVVSIVLFTRIFYNEETDGRDGGRLSLSEESDVERDGRRGGGGTGKSPGDDGGHSPLSPQHPRSGHGVAGTYHPLSRDHADRLYRDFYRVVVDWEIRPDWNNVLVPLRKEFVQFQRDVLQQQFRWTNATTMGAGVGMGTPRARHHRKGSVGMDLRNVYFSDTGFPQTHEHDHLHGMGKDETMPPMPSTPMTVLSGEISPASEGNILEAINLALNPFDKHYIDRDLLRTGLSIVVVTAGTGLFEVDKKLCRLTTQRMIDNGIGLDLVCLSKPPLYTVPLFQFVSKNVVPEESREREKQVHYQHQQQFRSGGASGGGGGSGGGILANQMAGGVSNNQPSPSLSGSGPEVFADGGGVQGSSPSYDNRISIRPLNSGNSNTGGTSSALAKSLSSSGGGTGLAYFPPTGKDKQSIDRHVSGGGGSAGGGMAGGVGGSSGGGGGIVGFTDKTSQTANKGMVDYWDPLYYDDDTPANPDRLFFTIPHWVDCSCWSRSAGSQGGSAGDVDSLGDRVAGLASGSLSTSASTAGSIPRGPGMTSSTASGSSRSDASVPVSSFPAATVVRSYPARAGSGSAGGGGDSYFSMRTPSSTKLNSLYSPQQLLASSQKHTPPPPSNFITRCKMYEIQMMGLMEYVGSFLKVPYLDSSEFTTGMYAQGGGMGGLQHQGYGGGNERSVQPLEVDTAVSGGGGGTLSAGPIMMSTSPGAASALLYFAQQQQQQGANNPVYYQTQFMPGQQQQHQARKRDTSGGSVMGIGGGGGLPGILIGHGSGGQNGVGSGPQSWSGGGQLTDYDKYDEMAFQSVTRRSGWSGAGSIGAASSAGAGAVSIRGGISRGPNSASSTGLGGNEPGGSGAGASSFPVRHPSQLQFQHHHPLPQHTQHGGISKQQQQYSMRVVMSSPNLVAMGQRFQQQHQQQQFLVHAQHHSSMPYMEGEQGGEQERQVQSRRGSFNDSHLTLNAGEGTGLGIGGVGRTGFGGGRMPTRSWERDGIESTSGNVSHDHTNRDTVPFSSSTSGLAPIRIKVGSSGTSSMTHYRERERDKTSTKEARLSGDGGDRRGGGGNGSSNFLGGGYGQPRNSYTGTGNSFKERSGFPLSGSPVTHGQLLHSAAGTSGGGAAGSGGSGGYLAKSSPGRSGYHLMHGIPQALRDRERDHFPGGMHPQHPQTSNLVIGQNYINPCNPSKTFIRTTPQIRRWAHVFPKGVIDPNDFDMGTNWKSLCTPACLPLTTDSMTTDPAEYFSSRYVEFTYTVSPADDITPYQDDRATNEEKRVEALLMEMVSQRLAQGFQAMVKQKDASAVLPGAGNSAVVTGAAASTVTSTVAPTTMTIVPGIRQPSTQSVPSATSASTLSTPSKSANDIARFAPSTPTVGGSTGKLVGNPSTPHQHHHRGTSSDTPKGLLRGGTGATPGPSVSGRGGIPSSSSLAVVDKMTPLKPQHSFHRSQSQQQARQRGGTLGTLTWEQPTGFSTTEPYVLGLGDQIHRLVYDALMKNIEVKRFVRKVATYKPEPITYTCAICPKGMTSYEPTTFTFSYPPLADYNWNYLDHLISGYQEEMTESLRFWRTRFLLIPMETVSPHISSYNTLLNPSNENLDEEELRLAGFNKFVELFEKARWIHMDEREEIERRGSKKSLRSGSTTLNIQLTTFNTASFVRDELAKRASKVLAAASSDGTAPSEPGAASIPGPTAAPHNATGLSRSSSFPQIAAAMQSPTGVTIKDRRWHFRLYQRVFLGNECVEWMIRAFHDIDNCDQAVEFGNELL